MTTTFKYPLTGVAILLVLVYFMPACDGILSGLLEEGKPVQVHLELLDSSEEIETEEDTDFPSRVPVVEEVTFQVADIVINGTKAQNPSGDELSFVVADSVVTLFPGDPGRNVSEKVIPEGRYSLLQVLFGGSDSGEGQTSKNHASYAVAVSGSVGKDVFVYTLADSLKLDLPMNPALRIGKSQDSLTIISVAFDHSKWFLGRDDKYLDPLNPEHHQQISENIRNSVTFSIKSIRQDRRGPPQKNNQVGLQGDVSSEEGAGSMIFVATLSDPATDTVWVDYATSDNSAKADKDYTAASGTLVFPPGETTRSVTVKLMDDANRENDEKFTLRLSNPVNADLIPKSRHARGVIIDDDSK